MSPPVARFAVKRRRARARYELGLEIDGGVVVWRFELAAPAVADDERVLTRAGRRDLDWLSAEGLCADGGGPAIVWDRGGFVCEGDPIEGLARGKLRFELCGFKLAGLFALGRNKGTWLGRGKGWRASEDWTLVMVPGQRPAPSRPPTSVLSGGSIDDPSNEGAAAGLAASLAGAPKRAVARDPGIAMRPAAGRRPPFSDPAWIFELRRGGLEVLAGRYRNRGELRDVAGRFDAAELRRLFPELALHLGALPVNRLLLHGEISVDDERQLPDAAELERRLGLDDDAAISAASLRRPACLRVFDLLAADGRDARGVELAARKSMLEALLPEAGPLRYADHIAGEGEALAARIAGAPGCAIAARRADSIYTAGPSDAWLAIEPTGERARPDEPDRARRSAPAQRLTNRRKIFWPDDGLTKGDLLDYYRDVAPVLLPHLADRPVVLARYPDGIYGRWFFQHHAPGAKSSFLRTVRIRTSRRPRDYFLIDDVAALLYLINMGTIPLHAWPCRAGSLERPDWTTVDVDRSKAGRADVVAMTLAVRELCEEVELPTFVKTSGGTGMHVMIPLGGQLDWDQARMLAEILARTVEARHPDRATTRPSIADRGERVYLDFMVNARGRLLIAPYSARARPGATVSTPLEWSEIDEAFDPKTHSILTIPARMAGRADPHAGLLDVDADIGRSIALLT